MDSVVSTAKSKGESKRRVTVQISLHFMIALEQSFAIWVHSETSSANDNNTCSEASHHGRFDSIVMMYCVSLSEPNMSIPESSSMDANQDKMACLSAKTR